MSASWKAGGEEDAFLRDTSEKCHSHLCYVPRAEPGQMAKPTGTGLGPASPSRVAVCPDTQRAHVNKEKGEVNFRRQVAGSVTPPDPLR